MLSDSIGVLQMMLWLLLALLAGCVAAVTLGVWDAARTWLLVVSFGSGIALYVGLLLLSMLYATRAAAGERADALSGDVTLAVAPPLERSTAAGLLAVASFVAGAALALYAVWA